MGGGLPDVNGQERHCSPWLERNKMNDVCMNLEATEQTRKQRPRTARREVFNGLNSFEKNKKNFSRNIIFFIITDATTFLSSLVLVVKFYNAASRKKKEAISK